MDREYVDSSMITSVGYDSNSGTLELEFKNGGAIWQYYDVQESTYYEFMSSGSLGKYFLANIKGQYTENRVG
ncbi:MAG: KTSC domain-containing protein [Ignavibacteriae bacterium]|nr:KTSC domain-containing protein [Ignavibacteriota bacterium]